MLSLSQGQRIALSQLGLHGPFTLHVTCDLNGADFVLFGLQNGKLVNDAFMVFFNQPVSPDHALKQLTPSSFRLDLDQLSPDIDEVCLTATHDDQPISAATHLRVTLGDATFDAQPFLQNEKAVMLVRFYRKDSSWRCGAVAQGFNGGLVALVQHFGAEVAEESAAELTPSESSGVSSTQEKQRVLLEKAEREQPQMVNLIKAAAVSLEKRGLEGARFNVKLVLDISASMRGEYASGSVQELANRALALAARLDNDGSVETYLFGIRAHRKGTLTLSNARDFVQEMDVTLESGTHYSPVMQMIREDVRQERSGLPTLVLFITDGGTSNPKTVINLMQQMSAEPIFWKFMGIEQGRVNFDFLEKLDDLTGRLVDNADFFRVQAPVRLPDAELFDLLVNELDVWQRDAVAAGIL